MSSIEKGVLKNLANVIGKHLCGSLFLAKFQALGRAALFKKNSNTVAFLWNLRNFYEHLFWRTSANDCFYILIIILIILSLIILIQF